MAETWLITIWDMPAFPIAFPDAAYPGLGSRA